MPNYDQQTPLHPHTYKVQLHTRRTHGTKMLRVIMTKDHYKRRDKQIPLIAQRDKETREGIMAPFSPSPLLS